MLKFIFIIFYFKVLICSGSETKNNQIKMKLSFATDSVKSITLKDHWLSCSVKKNLNDKRETEVMEGKGSKHLFSATKCWAIFQCSVNDCYNVLPTQSIFVQVLDVNPHGIQRWGPCGLPVAPALP